MKRETTALFILMLVASSSSLAASIHPSDKYAWGENLGWINHQDANGAVEVYADHLEGFAWAENLGWVKLGSHSGGGAHSYANSRPDDWGVNRAADGTLSGYAWSETAGWIDFGGSGGGGGVTIDPASGAFSGYAWGENLGWVKFAGTAPAYRVALAKRSVLAASGGNGTVGGGGDYPPFATVDLTATPDLGYALAGWAPAPCTAQFAMPDADLSCTATFTLEPDTDGDGVTDRLDNCPADFNPDQANHDTDPAGDSCDDDDDNDGYADTIDPDPLDPSVVPAARVGTRSETNPAFSLYLGATTQVTSFGLATDLPIIGDWDGDGLDNIGVYRPSTLRFYLDMNGNDVWDAADRVAGPYGASGDLPIAGDWNGDGRDEIGVYRPSNSFFYLDFDDSGSWTAADLKRGTFGKRNNDLPIIGDWDGDGIDDIGVYRPPYSYFYFDMDGDGTWSAGDLRSGGFGVPGDKPVIGDWNGDGIDEIGVYRPSSQRFYFDYDGSLVWDSTVDRAQTFGPAGALPFAGRW
jgi:hypothetical protein